MVLLRYLLEAAWLEVETPFGSVQLQLTQVPRVLSQNAVAVSCQLCPFVKQSAPRHNAVAVSLSQWKRQLALSTGNKQWHIHEYHVQNFSCHSHCLLEFFRHRYMAHQLNSFRQEQNQERVKCKQEQERKVTIRYFMSSALCMDTRHAAFRNCNLPPHRGSG